MTAGNSGQFKDSHAEHTYYVRSHARHQGKNDADQVYSTYASSVQASSALLCGAQLSTQSMLFLATVSHYQRYTFTVTYVTMDGGILGLKSEALLNYVGIVGGCMSSY